MPEYTLASVMRYRIDMRHCRRLLRAGSRSFHAASMLLPGYYRASATALYAFCRVADDDIDRHHGDGLDAVLQRLQRRLDAVYRGQPDDDPVDRALTDVVERFRVPRAMPDALLEGLEWDVRGRRYRSLSEVYAYAARVAGTVGAMMAVLMGAGRPTALARACDLGVAMQLTNIARDVGEDARAGRLYLPSDWLVEEGIDPDQWLARPDYQPGIGRVVDRLLHAADRLYDRSMDGIAELPTACRPGIHAARRIYREIGVALRRDGLDSVSRRTVVGAPAKLRMLAASVLDARRVPGADRLPPLDETRFLVDAVCAVPAE